MIVPLVGPGGCALLGEPDAVTMGRRPPPPAPGAAARALRGSIAQARTFEAAALSDNRREEVAR